MARHSSKWEETPVSKVARWALGALLLILCVTLLIPH